MSTGASTPERQVELAALIERFTGRDGIYATAIPPLCLHRCSGPSERAHSIFAPALGLVAQGREEVVLGNDLYLYDPAHYLVASVELPLASRVVEATPEAPYLSLRLDLQPAQIGALIMEMDLPAPAGQVRRGLAASRPEPGLLDAVGRLLRLLDTPRHIPVLAPLALREILYRLLIGEQGAQLRQVASANSHTRRIARAIDWLKRNYARPFRIAALAREVNLSPSGLHHHFKAATAMSPLQYQKYLRLQEARRLMLGELLDAATASHRVGYESPSQFSRDYRRLFGAPPLRDIGRLRRA